jgi:hypothetical protein
LNTNDFFTEAKALEKIRKTTSMELVQMSTQYGIHSYGLVDVAKRYNV